MGLYLGDTFRFWQVSVNLRQNTDRPLTSFSWVIPISRNILGQNTVWKPFLSNEYNWFNPWKKPLEMKIKIKLNENCWSKLKKRSGKFDTVARSGKRYILYDWIFAGMVLIRKSSGHASHYRSAVTQGRRGSSLQMFSSENEWEENCGKWMKF